MLSQFSDDPGDDLIEFIHTGGTQITDHLLVTAAESPHAIASGVRWDRGRDRQCPLRLQPGRVPCPVPIPAPRR